LQVLVVEVDAHGEEPNEEEIDDADCEDGQYVSHAVEENVDHLKYSAGISLSSLGTGIAPIGIPVPSLFQTR
jgi:hypothetical protein